MTKDLPKAMVEPTTGDLTTQASIGYYLYFRFSPQDQQIVIGLGAIAVTALICPLTAGIGCVVAAATAAASIALRVFNYYNPRCWIELKLRYNGTPAGVNRYWRC